MATLTEKDIKKAEDLEKFIVREIVAEKNGRPVWESVFEKEIFESELPKRKINIANAIGLLKKQAGIEKGDE